MCVRFVLGVTDGKVDFVQVSQAPDDPAGGERRGTRTGHRARSLLGARRVLKTAALGRSSARVEA